MQAGAHTQLVDFTHFHLYCGLGGGAEGFNAGQARVGSMQARYRCIGGVDSDPAAVADFSRAARVRGTVLDLFSRQQYRDFHGKEPPPGWREATTTDLMLAAGGEFPTCIFLSAPCKGFSGLLAESKSASAKYQALNGLTLRGMWLALETFKDDLPAFFIFENVPRIAKRGRHLLDQIVALLRHYGYAVAETAHDCGHLGGLAQTRKRFLMVARLRSKIPNFLYEPPKRRLKGVGEVLDLLPLPGDQAGGPMHRVPGLQWKTWVRLAFVEAGSDWRSLNRLKVEDGVLRDYAIEPAASWNRGVLGVRKWDDTSGTVTGRGSPTTGNFAVADPRVDGHEKSVQLGVRDWDKPVSTVKGDMSVGTGPYAVADPRTAWPDNAHQNKLKVIKSDEPASTVTGSDRVGSGALSVADGRPGNFKGGMGVTAWDDAANTIAGESYPTNGTFAVADPRTGWPDTVHTSQLKVTKFDESANVVTGAKHPAGGAQSVADPRIPSEPQDQVLGVQSWDEPAKTVSSKAGPTNGAYSVADPRTGADEESRFKNSLRVTEWDDAAGTVTSGHSPSNGGQAVADPRPEGWERRGQLGVAPWDRHVGTVTSQRAPGQGMFSVADPRNGKTGPRFNNVYRVVRMSETAPSVTGGTGPTAGGLAVADPIGATTMHGRGKYAVVRMGDPARPVIAESGTGNGAFAVADPRPDCLNSESREGYQTQGHYGVTAWEENARAIPAYAKNNNGSWSVADPRYDAEGGDAMKSLPAANDRLVCVIVAEDQTWHRPFTTLELAALQSLIDPEMFSPEAIASSDGEPWRLTGSSDSAWRERIGNAVPPHSAAAIASVMGQAYLLALAGETFSLSSADIWVQPMMVALSVDDHQPVWEIDAPSIDRLIESFAA